MRSSKWTTYLDEKLYPGVPGRWDDRVLREMVLKRMRDTDIVLDLGAGAGIVEEMNFLNTARKVCGVDPDARVHLNPHLDEARVGTGEAIPYDDGAFDLVIADNVLEHLADPGRVFREVHRVLRPGGIFLFKTPNKWHYMPLVARFTPHSFHGYFNRRRGRAVEDTFPTLYRANSTRLIKKLARDAGLEVELIRHVESRPEYLRFSAATYVVGYLYERLVNTFDRLSGLRIVLIGVLRRPAR